MTTPIKIGIAVACLVGIAGIIAIDQWKLRKEDSPVTAPAPVTIQTALPTVVPPPVAPVATPATDPVLCPAPEAPAKPETAPVAATPVKEKAPERVYTVRQGDSLYGISVKVFGTPRHYERIYEANRDRIKDPNTLQVGINLKMPEVAGPVQ